jgi:hypothetical protein
MQRSIRISVFLGVAAVLSTCGFAQDTAPDVMPELMPEAVPDQMDDIGTGTAISPLTFNGYSQYRQAPDLGAPSSTGHGFFHFSGPMHRFTTWYRPRAATLTRYQRCAPRPFRPRGLGTLFARPCDGYRIEYKPYQLTDSRSQYGPSYLARMPDPRCEDCDHSVAH